MKNFVPLSARVLISQIFLASGWGKIMDPSGTQHYMAAHGMPLTALFLVGAIVLELGGGLSVLLGYKARWGAVALIVFLIPTTLIFHTAFAERLQQIMFMKNSAILGGLLMVACFGSGPLSLDARTRSAGNQ
ncbi:MAG: DoxX family protein [Candidatus Hydrogenedentota bacterium]|nr:MAG: DoxX family protein [Candidatus Hydrogenedentota bacterium]